MELALRLFSAIAVSAGLYTAAAVYTPGATPLMLVVPLPGLVLAARGAMWQCGLWFFGTSGILTAGLGADAALGFVLPFGIPAVVLAIGIRRMWPFEHTVIAGIAAWAAGVLGLVLLSFGNFPEAVVMVRQQLTNSIDLALKTYESMGAPEATLATIAAQRDAMVTGLVETLPALVVLGGAFMIIVNLILLRNWTEIANRINLRLWRTPDVLIWALIVAGFGMFAPVVPISLIARNLFIIVLGGYFCQGLAIVSYYLERFRLPRGLRIAGYLLIAVQHIVAALVLVLGVFDLWGNFRRLNVGPADVTFHTDSD